MTRGLGRFALRNGCSSSSAKSRACEDASRAPARAFPRKTGRVSREIAGLPRAFGWTFWRAFASASSRASAMAVSWAPCRSFAELTTRTALRGSSSQRHSSWRHGKRALVGVMISAGQSARYTARAAMACERKEASTRVRVRARAHLCVYACAYPHV
eukprot:6192471-Pleurochrysis_carterae.AAC.1